MTEDYTKRRYGKWAGNPQGNAYVEGRCAEEVSSEGVWFFYQCSRKNGHGKDGAYCKQHAKRYPKEVEK